MAEGNGGSGSGSGGAAGVRVEAESSEPKRTTLRAMPREECVEGIRSALQNPTVRFLTEKMEKAGCQVWPRFIKAATCAGAAGGYSSGHGVKVCCNHMVFQDQITQVLIHELIHAYDDCVAKNLDWKNCAHHACSEIRANHLSGDCHYKRELLRGFMKIRGHEQVNVVALCLPPWVCIDLWFESMACYLHMCMACYLHVCSLFVLARRLESYTLLVGCTQLMLVLVQCRQKMQIPFYFFMNNIINQKIIMWVLL
ncbi:mitochondrial inner membrane protease ATP23 isoform X1 [Sorghum bicolor]|uniref:Mitochondrial inner membrane protease ATP23 n=1 Tax=Sorghum bicolor TaxID=4558 RepID=A0A1Z5RDH7_SORBI|nr:mitochondrial inner membrane protease ATP23 isoform X1 [Sorghum bicolor]OQU81813.1 hypothetical protein SORBI_3006G124300 [Sorghum bicolor]|eukprot:XP_021318071.1 mitochondrial inner membrane protease ATP23 isoform X1 [Sorghum bicolor]